MSLLILNFPWIENFLSIFFDSNQEYLGNYIGNGNYERATSVFTNGEEFGELILILFPFAIYKLFSSPKKIYWFFTWWFLIGLVISGTRSAFFLIIFQFFAYVYILVPIKYNKKKILVTVFFVITFVIMLSFLAKYTPILTDRVQATINQIKLNEDILTITNRAEVWPMAYELQNSISLCGHGPIQAHGLGFPVKNFHNLYLSLLFQFGIIGSFIFYILFILLAKNLFSALKNYSKSDHNYLLILACLLSLISFLINELKFEFNRSDSYQQFVWCYLAVIYLTGTLSKNNEKSNYHNPRTIRVSY